MPLSDLFRQDFVGLDFLTQNLPGGGQLTFLDFFKMIFIHDVQHLQDFFKKTC